MGRNEPANLASAVVEVGCGLDWLGGHTPNIIGLRLIFCLREFPWRWPACNLRATSVERLCRALTAIHLMALFQLFKFFAELPKYVSPDEAHLRELGVDAARHASFHRRIVRSAVIAGCLGAGLGISLIAVGARTDNKDTRSVPANRSDNSGASVLLAPLLFAAMGIVFGTATGCLFAPRAFLEGPGGQRWMRLIGTQSILVARIVCLCFTLLLLAFICLMTWAAWTDMRSA